ISESPSRHSFADIKFVFRVNVACFADIDRHNETGVRCVECGEPLRLTHMTPRFVSWFRFGITIVWQLHDGEREVAFTPALPPGSDHGWQQESVLLCASFV